MLAYNAMQLTGWSQYDYQNQGSGGNMKQEGKIQEDHNTYHLGKGGKQSNRKHQHQAQQEKQEHYPEPSDHPV